MDIKIITKEEAIKLGLTKSKKPLFAYGGIGKVSDAPMINGKRDIKEKDIHQRFRVNLETKEMEILYENPEYKIVKKRLQINEDKK